MFVIETSLFYPHRVNHSREVIRQSAKLRKYIIFAMEASFSYPNGVDHCRAVASWSGNTIPAIEIIEKIECLLYRSPSPSPPCKSLRCGSRWVRWKYSLQSTSYRNYRENRMLLIKLTEDSFRFGKYKESFVDKNQCS